MKNNISCVNLCTGCSTCLNICPHKAIKIKINQEGFYSPEVDERICTDCGLCLKKCPLYNANYNNFDNPTCYAAYATDNFRCGSSSGGVFPIIAKYVIDQKGIVCGAAWTEENTVKHIIIDQTSDIIKLQGSKYLQSYIGDTYRQIKQFLKMDKLVLFSGTPCQVAGLKSFLSFDYRNLITIEVICHGVPSVSIYKKYIKELISSEDEVVISTNFRDKINGWNPYLTTTTTTKGNYSFPAVSDTFLLAFLKNLSLSKACGSCIYAKVPRQADITLGDFWRIDEYDKSLNDGKGTSVILVNSPKGSFVLDRIKNNLKLLRKVPISYAIKGNPNIVRPVMLHKERDNFFLRMDQYTLQDNLDLSLGKKYDCAILNLWHTNNFGALLTCYALQEIIKKIGKVPRVINYLPGDWQYRFHNNISEEFSAKYLELTSLCKNKLDLIKLNRETNSFIVGSDQVWRYKYIKNYGSDVYALSFAASNANKISYAASFGISSFEANDEEINNFNFYLNRFNSISVRENDGVKLCKSTFNVNATQVLDPVFLLETYYWDNMIFNDVERKRKKYSLVSYVLDQNDNSEQLISDLELKLNTKCFRLNDAQRVNSFSVNVEDWLYYIKNSSFFITDSFHGMCFAIIFNIQFVCLCNDNRGKSRFDSLSKLLGLESRCISRISEFNLEELIINKINYKFVNSVLCKEKDKSIFWLKSALDSCPKHDKYFEIFDMLQYKIDLLNQKINMNNSGVSINTEDLFFIINYSKFRLKYYRYKLLYKLTFGKMKLHYKNKYYSLKFKFKRIKSLGKF